MLVRYATIRNEGAQTQMPLASDAARSVLRERDVHAVGLLDETFGVLSREGEIAAGISSSGTTGRERRIRPTAWKHSRQIYAHLIMLAHRAEGLFGSSWTSFSRWW